jgi:hypothetical protein
MSKQNQLQNKTQKGFTTVLNAIVNYQNKSMKCLGLYIYLASKPETWSFNDTDILNHFTDGETALATAKKELKDLGLLQIVSNRDEKGKIINWTWILSSEIVQIEEKPTTGKTHNLDNTTTGKTTPYSKTNSISKTNNSNIKNTKKENLEDLRNINILAIEEYSKTLTDNPKETETEWKSSNAKLKDMVYDHAVATKLIQEKTQYICEWLQKQTLSKLSNSPNPKLRFNQFFEKEISKCFSYPQKTSTYQPKTYSGIINTSENMKNKFQDATVEW